MKTNLYIDQSTRDLATKLQNRLGIKTLSALIRYLVQQEYCNVRFDTLSDRFNAIKPTIKPTEDEINF